jgi:uncharacterized membrane protein YphA (DoxX/SURF4 family)
MTLRSVASRATSWLRAARALAAFLPPLLGRLFLFYAFHVSGTGKLAHLERAADFAGALGIPAPALYVRAVAHLEAWGAWLLLLGVLTRPTALLLGLTSLVALATADRGALLAAVTLTGQTDVLGVAPLVLLVPLAWLAVEGAGLLSLDGLVARLLRRGPGGASHHG